MYDEYKCHGPVVTTTFTDTRPVGSTAGHVSFCLKYSNPKEFYKNIKKNNNIFLSEFECT